MKVALYARVSTADQTCENQLIELRQYCAARQWADAREFVDTGVSGAAESRPELDHMRRVARRRQLDVIVCWRLDRLGRSLKHLVLLLDELQELGVRFVSLNEGIDMATPAGRLQFQILAALAEYERFRIRERVVAGLARVKAAGKRLGRPEKELDEGRIESVRGLPIREAAKRLGVSRSTAQRWLSR